MEITHIIFDLGGVLLKIHPENFIQLHNLTSNEIQKDITLFTNETTLGQKDIHTAMKELIQKHKLPLTADKMMKSYQNDYLGEVISPMYEFVKNSLIPNYKVCLLSNTNSAHMDFINPLFNYFNDFYKIYLSYDIHLMKPDKKIYQYVLHDLQIHPNNALFIDDIQENLTSANELGINTIKVTPNQPELVKIKSLLSI